LHRPSAILFLSSAALLSSLAGCASAGGPPSSCGTSLASCLAEVPCVPDFCPDGRLRRDLLTDAPLFVAAPASLASQAPRFNDDGSVCRDSATGAPLYEDVAEGKVVRVLVGTR
jgi:hypothetical protein